MIAHSGPKRRAGLIGLDERTGAVSLPQLAVCVTRPCGCGAQIAIEVRREIRNQRYQHSKMPQERDPNNLKFALITKDER